MLEGWQCWWLSTLFGWVDAAGLRRFQEAHLWVPKKNGKSTLAAAVALYCLCADTEGTPEIYVAAAKMEQARIVADIAHAMARRSPGLRSAFALTLTGGSSARPPHLRCGLNDGVLRPLARDQAGSQDGLDVHAAIVDEIHAHRTPDMYQILAQGTASRAQPLTVITSTAGFDLEGIGKKRYDALVDVLRGRDVNDGLFGCVWEADESDDWRAQSTWRRANPNLGVISVTIRSLEQQSSNDEHVFRVKRLNQWASSHREWMDMSAWRLAARTDLSPPPGAPIWIGVHVSAGAEPSAGCAMWFDGDDWRAVFQVWVPAAAAGRYEEEMDCSGEHRIRLDDITDWLLSWGDAVRAVCIDPRASGPLATVWEPRGLSCVNVAFSPANVSFPMRRWQALVAAGGYQHNGLAIVDRMLRDTVEVVRGDGVSSFPGRAARHARIDAVIAQLLCAAVAIGWREPEPEPEPGRFIDLALND